MIDQFNSAHYRTRVKALELYIVLEPGRSTDKRNCFIKNGVKIPQIWCLGLAIVDLFYVVEQLNSTAPLHDMYDMIVNSLADLVYGWRYNLIFGDELSTIFYEEQQEVLIELTEEQARLETERLSQAPFSKSYARKLVREFDAVRKCGLAAQALEFIT